jgi:thioredoxin-like negative regulator of GroEL
MKNPAEILAESFELEVLKSDGPVVVEFFSHACPHCKRFRPIYEQLSEALKEKAKFVEFDVLLNEDNRNFALLRGVHSVPTVEIFYHGRILGSTVGYHPLETMMEAVEVFLANKDKHVGPSTPLHELKAESTRTVKAPTKKHSSKLLS